MLFSSSLAACPCGFYIHTPTGVTQRKRGYASVSQATILKKQKNEKKQNILCSSESSKGILMVYDFEMAAKPWF